MKLQESRTHLKQSKTEVGSINLVYTYDLLALQHSLLHMLYQAIFCWYSFDGTFLLSELHPATFIDGGRRTGLVVKKDNEFADLFHIFMADLL